MKVKPNDSDELIDLTPLEKHKDWKMGVQAVREKWPVQEGGVLVKNGPIFALAWSARSIGRKDGETLWAWSTTDIQAVFALANVPWKGKER